MLFLYAYLLFGLTQQEHTPHLLCSHRLFQAGRNLLKGEAEILERKYAMEP